MSSWYGSVVNRIEEGRTVPEIKEGMDITMYYWSDRTCYYVTEVESQKRIKVKRYKVVADRDLPGGMGHQNWKYFKTNKECNDYLKSYGLGTDEEPIEYETETWVYRYNHWTKAYFYDEKFVKEYYEDLKVTARIYNELDYVEQRFQKWLDANFTENEQKKIRDGKTVTHYYPLDGKISFNVRDYYYDWEF